MRDVPCQRTPDPTNAIRRLLREGAAEYAAGAAARMAEMDLDHNAHRLVFKAFGVRDDEAELIDRYQNKGRLLYAQAGQVMGKALLACFQSADPAAARKMVPNIVGTNPRPKEYEIDCLLSSNEGIEFKWRDNTTDGDHVRKEENRIRSILAAGYVPVRLILFAPERKAAMKVQRKMKPLYDSSGGRFLVGDEAFRFVEDRTGIDLHAILAGMGQETSA